MFFAIDGDDGTGKSTQIELLAQWLEAQGQHVVICHDPGSTPAGEEIRSLLLHRDDLKIGRRCEMLLYMAARAQLVEEVIRPALAAGKTVISDRYLLSNIAYQGYGGGLDIDSLWQVGYVATANCTPNLTLVLDTPPDVAAARIDDRRLDRIEARGSDFHARVRYGFVTEAGRRSGQIVVVDAARSVEKVQDDLRLAVQRVLRGQAYEEVEDSADAQAFGGLA